MSQNTAKRDPHTEPEDVVNPDGTMNPDEPDEAGFELIGGVDDLGPGPWPPHQEEKHRTASSSGIS